MITANKLITLLYTLIVLLYFILYYIEMFLIWSICSHHYYILILVTISNGLTTVCLVHTVMISSSSMDK